MKKSNLLVIPLSFLAAFLGIMLSNANNVVAANNKLCSPEYFRDNYMTKIDVKYGESQVTITNNTGLNLSYEFFKDGNTDNGISGDFNDGTSATLQVVEGGSISFTLKDGLDGVCNASAGSELGLMEVNADGLVDNPLYNDALCVNYRNKWGNNQTMQNAVPYCYESRTYSSYSREQVQGWINTAESLYTAMDDSNNTDIIIDNTYKEVEDVKHTDKLMCDAFSTNNYETPHKYYHISKTTENNCEVTCKEEIEVNFSDPVATQAGMCFQYLIEIKSKVVCDGRYKGEPPVRRSVCYPNPVCINGGRAFDAGGPTEDFDSCVTKCDGGAYTQKCIDKCYNKVYKNTKSKAKKTTNDSRFTKEEMKSLSVLNMTDDSFYSAVQTAANCSWSTVNELYALKQAYPGGYYKNGRWIPSGTCSGAYPNLGPYYFRSLAQTQKTVNMLRGSYSYSSRNKYYTPRAGFLNAVHKNNTYCTDSCYWRSKCGSDMALTETIAQQEYEEAVKKYMQEKEKCEQKAATCTNESTDYKIVVDNKDNDNDSKDDQQSFESSQKMNSNKITGDFISMVILADGSCEDGEDDPWHYHNIITFPGAWINNKTGQIVHTMDKDREDFYTYVGNQYCTKLNSLPVNTAWYDWKVNKNGDQSALTDAEKDKIVNNLDMNIKGNISNYGYFGWNFDVECFYAVDKPGKSCSKEDANWPDCDETGDRTKQKTSVVDDYTFRSVALDNVFPSKTGEERKLGYNWTCEATNLENPDYLIQPVTVKNNIQSLGDRVYEGNDYLDYHVRLTPDTIKKVRAYNKSYDSYVEPTSDSRKEVLSAGSNKTAGITVYKSRLLHSVLNGNELLKKGVIGCNNEDKGSCLRGEAAIDKTTSCYNEYMAQSAITKGVK